MGKLNARRLKAMFRYYEEMEQVMPDPSEDAPTSSPSNPGNGTTPEDAPIPQDEFQDLLDGFDDF